MNALSIDQKVAVVAALVEGASIRAVERMTGVHRDTIMALARRVGAACERLMAQRFQDLPCREIQVDEIWCYVGKKQRHVKAEDDPAKVGDTWTFVAIDPETKLVPAFEIGKRDMMTAMRFMDTVAARLRNRVQVSSDQLQAYRWAVNRAFDGQVDYGVVVKTYEAEPLGPGRYSPPKVASVTKKRIMGNPDVATLSTSHVERNNLTMRMGMRRFTRLTNGFSKTQEGLRAAVGLHFGHYNFVRRHKTLRTTPAVAVGVESREWSLDELVSLAS